MPFRRERGPSSPVYLDTQAGDTPVPVTLDTAAITDLNQVSEVLGTANPGAAQTNVLLAQPAAGMRLVLTGVLVSTDTAGAITLLSGGGSCGGPIYLGANASGNVIWPDPLRLGANQGLRYTSTIAGNYSITAYGWEE